MPMLKGLLVQQFLFPTLVLAQEATVTEIHDSPPCLAVSLLTCWKT